MTKKITFLLLALVAIIFIVLYLNNNIFQDKTSDFSVLISTSSTQPGSLPDYITQVSIDSRKQIKIIKPKKYPAWGDIITWDTKSATLTDNELLEFKTLLNKINISKLPSGYICKYSTMKECYVGEPILQATGVPTMILEINGIQKEIHMSTSNGMPNTLKEIMKKMISIRDDLATMPWSEQTSTYKQLFNQTPATQ